MPHPVIIGLFYFQTLKYDLSKNTSIFFNEKDIWRRDEFQRVPKTVHVAQKFGKAYFLKEEISS